MKHLITLTFLSIFGLTFAQIPSYVPSNGLVGWWPFNGNANDESGNGNNGTVNGATLTSDRFGNVNCAYNFNSNPDVITCNSMSFQNQEFTISGWFKLQSGFSYTTINIAKFGPNDNNSPGGYSLRLDQNDGICGAGNYQTYGYISDNSNFVFLNQVSPYTNFATAQNWNHYVITKSADSLKIFLNNNLLNSAYVQSLNISFINAILQFGNQQNLNNNPAGSRQLDDIGIWNRALTQSEITNLYNSVNTPAPTVSVSPASTTVCPGSPVTLTAATTGSTACSSAELPSNLQTGLVGYWPFCGNANDASGNGYHGQIVNQLNGISYSQDRFGNNSQAIKFNSQSISPSLAPYLNALGTNTLSLTDYSINIWSKIEMNSQVAELINRGPDNNSFFSRFQGLNGIAFGNAPSYLNHIMPIDTTQWHMYTFSRGSNGMGYLYYDGNLLFSQPISAMPNNGNNFVFGKMPSGGTNGSYYPYQGKLDDIAIWNRALTATEIQQLYTTSNATYSWSPGGATTPSITVSPTTTTTYTVTATANGQSSTSTAVVTVTTPPTITASSSTICAGQSATLTAAAAGSSTTTPCSGLTGSLSSGLVGYWPFCGNANDASGNGNNGTVTGATLTTDRFGNASSAYNFDGASYIQVNPSSSYNSNTTSVSCWFNRVSSADNDALVGLRDNVVTNTRYSLHINNNNNGIGAYNGTLYNTISTSFQNNIWYHTVFVFQTNICHIYVNGLYLGSINCTLGNGTTNNLWFGQPDNTIQYNIERWIGKLDDIGIWNRALTTAEIQQLYTQGQTTYSWSPGGETTPSITVSPTSTTTYTCSVTTNGTTCSSSQTITVNALPVASITPAGPVSLCQGQSVTLCAPNTPGLTYLWCNASTTSCITTNFAGNYCLVVTDANGCTSNSVSTIVDVLPLPTANAGADFTKTCVANPSGALVGMTSVAGNTYAWTPATGLSSASSANPTANPTATTTYTLTATNTASGCTATDQVLVTVNTALPTVNAGLDQTLCQGVSTMLNASSNGATLSWNNGVQNNVSFVPSTVGSTTYTATAIGSNGCTANDNVVVTVNPLPSTAVTTNGTSSFCPGSSVQLCAPSGTGYSYLWSGNLGTTQCVTLSSSATTSVTVTNAFNCSATSAPQQVTVFNNPIASAGLDATITCVQNASGAQIGDVPNPTYTYSWTPSSGLSSATIGNPIANPSTTTTYTLTVVNADGCMGSDQVTVTVNNALPTANAGQGGIITCAQNVNGVQLGAGPINGNTYSWTPTSGLNNSNIANPTATPNTSTTYTLLMSDANGCSDTAQVVVTVNNNAPIVFAGNDVNVCYGDSLYLLANTTIGSTVLWNATIQNGSNILPTQAGYQVATATATNGCTSQDSLLVSILQPTTSTLNEVACDEFILNGNVYLQSGTYTQLLTNTAGCDSTITLNLTINLSPDTPVIYVQNEVNLSTDVILGQTYQWIYCSDLIPVPGATNPTFNPTVNAIYAVVITNNCGSDTSSCTTVSTIGLADSQQPEVEIYPNPNNGHFTILLPENNGSAKLEVLDLNGRIIFESILDQQANELHLETLSSGTYWLRINHQVPVPVTKY